MIRIIHAQTGDHYRRTRELFEQYADALSFDLEFQGFRRELTTLPGAYAPPKGCILLAENEEEIVEVVCIGDDSGAICNEHGCCQNLENRFNESFDRAVCR
mgnify:CR=1 FL=1